MRGCSSGGRLRRVGQGFADLRGWVLVGVLVWSAGYDLDRLGVGFDILLFGFDGLSGICIWVCFFVFGGLGGVFGMFCFGCQCGCEWDGSMSCPRSVRVSLVRRWLLYGRDGVAGLHGVVFHGLGWFACDGLLACFVGEWAVCS